jgi:hypothetical protein
MTPGFTWASGYRLAPGQPTPGGATLLRHPIACLLPDRIPRSPDKQSRRTVNGFGWLASPASARTHCHGHGNINPLSIDYACRPRLRSRLTLGGLTWPRNPWSFGGRGSHSAFATHACILTRTPSTPGSPRGFTGCTTLPYPTPRLHQPGTNPQPADLMRCCHGFGGALEPRYIVGAGPLDQ